MSNVKASGTAVMAETNTQRVLQQTSPSAQSSPQAADAAAISKREKKRQRHSDQIAAETTHTPAAGIGPATIRAPAEGAAPSTTAPPAASATATATPPAGQPASSTAPIRATGGATAAARFSAAPLVVRASTMAQTDTPLEAQEPVVRLKDLERILVKCRDKVEMLNENHDNKDVVKCLAGYIKRDLNNLDELCEQQKAKKQRTS